MRTDRQNKLLASIIDEGTLLQRHHGRYEAAVFMLMYHVKLRLIVRVLAPLPRRR